MYVGYFCLRALAALLLFRNIPAFYGERIRRALDSTQIALTDMCVYMRRFGTLVTE